jgi:lysozyme family protein
MVAATYNAALARLLAHEGGYTNHPADPGGPTNFGITIHDYRRYVKPNATAADVRAMRVEEAKAIYRCKYWSAMRCDELPAGLDYAVFDYAVNSGTGRVPKVLARLLGAPVDGRMSDGLMAALRRRDASAMIGALCDERLAFLRQLKTWPVFGGGWSRRVAEVRSAALAMAGEGKPRLPAAPAPGRAVVAENKVAQRASAGVVVVSGAAAAQQAHQSGARGGDLILIITVTLAVAFATWLFWHWRQKRKQEASSHGS